MGTGETHSGLINAVIQMFGHGEGISDLSRKFEQHGMGDIISSWIGAGANRSVSPEAIQNVLGDERIRELAAKAGLSPDAASQKLATILPMVVDKSTPQGRIPGDTRKAS